MASRSWMGSNNELQRNIISFRQNPSSSNDLGNVVAFLSKFILDGALHSFRCGDESMINNGEEIGKWMELNEWVCIDGS